jgi:hypothetical protein
MYGGYTTAKKVNHGNLRDDRPSHGRDVRASKDGLAACRRVNGKASLYMGLTDDSSAMFLCCMLRNINKIGCAGLRITDYGLRITQKVPYFFHQKARSAGFWCFMLSLEPRT